jgi:hypothetical protein
MTVLDRLRTSISRRSDQVILRSELEFAGGKSQLTSALGKLVKEGTLMRMTTGVFARARRDSSGHVELLSRPERVLKELFGKLRITATLVTTEQHQDHSTYVFDVGHSRMRRQLHVGRDTVRYVGCNQKRQGLLPAMPANLEQLPTSSVAKFLVDFAKAHDVKPHLSGLDVWAEAVTQAAGDHVHLDATGRLLVSLYEARLINGRQMARLMTNYTRELHGNDASHDLKTHSSSPAGIVTH